MAGYHVGCGLMEIYAGTLNKAGNMWTRKSEVTKEALIAAADYLYINEKEFRFDVDGGHFAMRIVELGDDDD